MISEPESTPGGVPYDPPVPERDERGAEKYAFGKIPHKAKCQRCQEFDLDGCPNCPGFSEY